ncbi:hypothetical protein LTR62_005531 [Meristemomyces frigidus]|uniref:Asl1-like glycosyl hydrolase catalytic domain-containing protein n=1 Tax=Meristemomyces frigidus TaxID=1508187 RepID=A0AAN7TCQ8_9PEZI|nr:hypothetical protein LTR62_005531 [Meristemomyces frigidus]
MAASTTTTTRTSSVPSTTTTSTLLQLSSRSSTLLQSTSTSSSKSTLHSSTSSSLHSTGTSSSSTIRTFSVYNTATFAPTSVSSPPCTATHSAVPSPYVINAGKRGLVYTNGTLTLPYSQAGQKSLVNWGYNYYLNPGTGTNQINKDFNPALTFIPMLFNDNDEIGAAWPATVNAAICNGADAILSFNEPDACGDGSACMTVNQSVVGHRKYMEPFAGRIRIGAPAVTNGGPPSSLTYLSEFMGNCTDCTIDFIPIHWYSCVYCFSYLQYYVETVWNTYGIPIWLTEFGIDSSGGTDALYQSFIKESISWLDAVPYVERYAYFGDFDDYLINSNGTGLSAQGVIYNNYTAPCPNWNNSNGTCTFS